ncbi:YigZ family protein [Gleimia hominis]|uniref:YigZ family protein n=1 Tax=Gleimia hominis TaxID=595468 RepID=A0ABU3ID57_9ACTO|nr:YigZ family protein [Gleimia hominis]MDT3767437.1 YigZ family protein [Gleimia hominis]
MRSIQSGSLVRHELEVQRSRFITTVAHTPTESAARTFISEIKTEFPDATHNCSAFVVKPEGMNEVGHSSDDGEPSGTAGPPMLEVLLQNKLVNVTAVVTRYFGGTLLGAGGLIRAYSTSVSETLDRCQVVQLVDQRRFRVTVDYDVAGRLEAQLRARHAQILDAAYTNRVQLVFSTDEPLASKIESLIAEVASEPVPIEELDPLTVEKPVSR